jgi:hypothetical protein
MEVLVQVVQAAAEVPEITVILNRVGQAARQQSDYSADGDKYIYILKRRQKKMPISRNQILLRRGTTSALVSTHTDDEDRIAYGEPVFDVEKNYLSIGVRDTNDEYRTPKELFPIKVRTLQG